VSGATDEPRDVALEELFNYSRLRRPLSKLEKLFWLMYSPIGIGLMVVRFFAFFSVFFTSMFMPTWLARRWLVYSLYPILGLIIKEKNTQYRDAANRPAVLVANHISDYDTYVLPIACHHAGFHPRPVISAHTTQIPIIGPVIKHGYRPWGPIWVPAKMSTDDTRKHVRSTLVEEAKRLHGKRSDNPITILPEGGLTNGRVGLLLFKRFIFSLGLPVQPYAQRYHNCWPFEHDYLGSKWIWNMCWMLFLPFHVQEIIWLPPMYPKEGESATDYAARVQQAIAKELGQSATKHSYDEKVALRMKLYGR